MRLPRPILLLVACVAAGLAGCAESRPTVPPKPLPPLTAGARGHIVFGPYVQPGGPDLAASMTLVWWTDADGPGRLDWREVDGPMGGDVTSRTESYEGWVRHTARIERPRGGQDTLSVMATVTVDGTAFTSRPQTVRYAPGRGQALRFAALGDTGAGTASERRVVNLIEKENVSLLLITGDVAYSHGDWEDYRRRFFPYYADLMASVPILPALGNHDVGNPKHMGEPFRMVWTPPDDWRPPAGATQRYSLNRRRSNRTEGPVPAGQDTPRNYSADAGDCHFVCLDSTADHDTIEKLVAPWLKEDLAAARAAGAKWFIAYWHHPPYTRGGYKDNSLQWQDMRDLYLPILKAAGVQLVLNGHDHGFQRMEKDGIAYIVTGGGGAGLYHIDPSWDRNGQPPLLAWNDKVRSFTLLEQSADGRSLSIRQIDENGKTLDTVTLHAS